MNGWKTVSCPLAKGSRELGLGRVVPLTRPKPSHSIEEAKKSPARQTPGGGRDRTERLYYAIIA